MLRQFLGICRQVNKKHIGKCNKWLHLRDYQERIERASSKSELLEREQIMKVFIYIACFFVMAIIQVAIKNAGILLGAIPTVLLYLVSL